MVALMLTPRICKFSFFRECYFLTQFWTKIPYQRGECDSNYCANLIEIIANKFLTNIKKENNIREEWKICKFVVLERME